MNMEECIKCPVLTKLRNERDELKITVKFLTKNNADLLAQYSNDTKALREEFSKLNGRFRELQTNIAQAYELISKYKEII